MKSAHILDAHICRIGIERVDVHFVILLYVIILSEILIATTYKGWTTTLISRFRHVTHVLFMRHIVEAIWMRSWPTQYLVGVSWRTSRCFVPLSNLEPIQEPWKQERLSWLRWDANYEARIEILATTVVSSNCATRRPKWNERKGKWICGKRNRDSLMEFHIFYATQVC